MTEQQTKGSILFKRDRYHEADAIAAIRHRDHPEWSQLKSSMRVSVN